MNFALDDDVLALPQGAWARTHRRMLRWRGREILGITQGDFRPYLYPVYTPAGFAITTERPADHPHHNSIWVAADHVTCRVPAGTNGFEDYIYNFYVDDVFQGRAPGRLVEERVTSRELAPDVYRIEQQIAWRGPAEWAARDGRHAVAETRVIDVTVAADHHVIDMHSTLSPCAWDLVLGPTRHAYFNFRVADSLRALSGGVLRDDADRRGGEQVSGHSGRWVSYAGGVGGGNIAGIALMLDPAAGALSWFASDWGVVTGGSFRQRATTLAKGQSAQFRARYVIHDGPADAKVLTDLHQAFVEAGAHSPIFK